MYANGKSIVDRIITNASNLITSGRGGKNTFHAISRSKIRKRVPIMKNIYFEVFLEKFSKDVSFSFALIGLMSFNVFNRFVYSSII
jgi:hypothetical protein